jgi:hypothetical protein
MIPQHNPVIEDNKGLICEVFLKFQVLVTEYSYGILYLGWLHKIDFNLLAQDVTERSI